MVMSPVFLRPSGPTDVAAGLSPVLLVDGTYQPGMQLIKAALLVNASNKYLSTGNVTATNSQGILDFSYAQGIYPANKWTVEINRNLHSGVYNGVNNVGLDRCYVCKGDFGNASNYGWTIRAGGSNLSQRELKILFITGTSTLNFAQTQGAPDNWSQAIVSFDLTLSSNQVKVYFDGSTTPCAIDGGASSLPGSASALPTGKSGAAQIGRTLNQSDNLDGAVSCIRMWRTVLAPAMMPYLYNGGFPLSFDQLAANMRTYLVANWDCREDAGSNRLDQTGLSAAMVEQGGSIEGGNFVARMADYGSRALTFVSQKFCYCPYWGLSPVNGLYGLKFSGQQWMWAKAAGWLSDKNATEWLAIAYFTELSLNNYDYALVSASKENYNNANSSYLFPMMYNSRQALRYRADVNGINAALRGTDATMVINTPYVLNWRMFGTGDTGAGESYEMRKNGTANPVDTTYQSFNVNNGGAWSRGPIDMDAHDAVVLGGLNYDTGNAGEGAWQIQDRLRGWIIRLAQYAATADGVPGTGFAALSQADNRAVESYYRTLAGV